MSDSTYGTVLVTGGCGYIGSHVVRQLSHAGACVVVLDDLRTGFRENLLHDEPLVVGNFGDEGLLAEVFQKFKISSVLHFAASAVLPESMTDPVSYYENNVVNTLRFFKSVAAHKIPHVVFSSTGSLYGDDAPVPTSEAFYPQPSNPYSKSKRVGEWMLEDIAQATGLKFVILRYFNVAGADPSGRLGQRSKKATHLIKIASEVAVGKRQQMFITGTDFDTPDGTGVRDYIHVEDLATAHLKALEYLRDGGSSTILNAGYGHGASVKEVIAAVERVSGRKLAALPGPRRPGDIAASVADATKIKNSLKWRPEHDHLESIVKSAMDWEKKT